MHFDANDSASSVGSVEARIDSGTPYIIGQEPWDLELKGLSDGWHTIEVTVYDQAGNGLNQTFSFKVDTNPLSPEGPFGPWVLIAIIALTMAVAMMALILRNRKK